jgi:hypothetical protein
MWRERYKECPSAKLRSLADAQPDAVKKYYLNAAAFAEHSQTHQNWFEGDQPDGSFLRMRPYHEVREEATKVDEKRKG